MDTAAITSLAQRIPCHIYIAAGAARDRNIETDMLWHAWMRGDTTTNSVCYRLCFQQ